MRELASQIKDNLESLVRDYERRLQEIPDYARLSDKARIEAAQNTIEPLVAGLETGDRALFTQSVQAMAIESASNGFEITSVQQALTTLADMIEPLLTTIKAANLMWRAIVQANLALSEHTERSTWQEDGVDPSKREGEEESAPQAQGALRAVIDSMPFGVVIISKDKKVRRANSAALATMGYEAEKQIVGRICHDTLCPAEADQCPILDLEQSVDRSERVLVTRDGSHVPILKSVVPMTLDGEDTLLEAFIDITERKQLAQQIEESLERRGRQLQTSTEVAQEIAAASALDELYLRVVTLVAERFGYYHTQIFRHDPAMGAMVVVAGYGQVGEKMRSAGHKLPFGRGVVGTAADTSQAVLASDVAQNPHWVPHPDLPHTKSELAVPIVLRDQVLGILDVQSDRANALTEEDLLLLEGLCGQIATAIESTRLRQELEENLRELERLYRTMSGEGWERFQQQAEATTYLFDQGDVLPTDAPWAPRAGQTEGQAAVAQLSVRGEAFGTLGVHDNPENPLSPDELALVESVAEQVAQALETARLLDDQQRARSLLTMRLSELDFLNDIGRKIDQVPQIDELLPWVAEQIRPVMQHPDLCRAAIELDGHVYGQTEAMALPCQIVQGMSVGGRRAGRITIAYTEEREFLDEESALLGDVTRRVSGYVENRRLFQQAQDYAEEQALLRRVTETTSRSLELEEMLDTALDESLTSLGFDAGLISLLDPETGELYLVAELGLPAPLAHQLQQEGLAGTLCDFVFQIGDAIAIADLREEAPVDATGVIQQGLLAYAGAPIWHTQEKLGTFCFFQRSVREVDDRELQLMEAIGSQIGVGVANTRLYQDAQTALAEAETVHRSYLRRGWQEHLRQREILQRGGFLYDTIQTGQAEGTISVIDLWRPEMEQALRQGGPVTAQTDDEGEDRVGLAVPITLRGQTLGVLGIEAPAGDYQWTEEDMALMEAVSDQLGQTLESARLFADTQRRAERERLIGEITAKIRASANIEDILETTATELAQALDTSRATVRLGFGESDRAPAPVDRGQALPEPDADRGQEVEHEE